MYLLSRLINSARMH